MKRKIFVLFTIAMALVMLLSACASNTTDNNTNTNTTDNTQTTDTTSPATTDDTDKTDDTVPVDPNATQPMDLPPITFTMFVGSNGQPPDKNNEVIKKVEEITKVHIDFEFLVGDLDQKMGVMIASGDYPDFIDPSQGRARFMDAGAFVPLQDLIPQYENIKTHYEPFMEKLYAASPDGKDILVMDNWDRYYGEPINTFYNGPAFWVQKDVLAQSGYPNPKTIEEFFSMLESYYAKNPTIDDNPTLPFEILSYDWRFFCLFNAPAHLIGGPNDGNVYVNQDTMTAEIFANKDYAKRYYEKLNEVYKKGLISPETFTQNYDQYLAKVASGRVLAMFDQAWNFQDGEDVLKGENKWDRTYVPLGLTYEGYTPWYMEDLGTKFVGGNGMGITVNCKDVDRAMLYIDTLLNEDIQKMLSWGIEGRDHYVENGRLRRTQEQKTNHEDPVYQVAHLGNWLHKFFPKIQGSYSDGNAVSPAEQREEILENQSPYDQSFFPNYGFATLADFLKAPRPNPAYYPVWGFTIKDGSDAKLAMTSLEENARKGLPRVIMADDFEAEWANYLASIEKINYQAYEDDVNKTIAKRMGITR